MDRNIDIMDEPDFDLFGLFDEIDNTIFGTFNGIDLAPGVKNETEAPTSSGVKNETEAPTSSKNKAPTFINITDEEKENFVSGMRNVNTVRKTESSVRVFQQWLAQPPRNDERNICSIMPPELDNYIGSFLLSVRKADGSDYEPDTLTSYHRSIDRYEHIHCMIFKILTSIKAFSLV
jgi:hypothetical protein